MMLELLMTLWLLGLAAPLFFFVQGCSCCGCTIGSDDFSRPDSDSPGDDWTELSGDADIVSGELKFSSVGLARYDLSHPDNGTAHYATSQVWLATSYSPQVCVNMKADGSEYHWARLELASATTIKLTVGKHTAAGDSALNTKTVNGNGDQFYSLTACYSDGVIIASAVPVAGSSVIVSAASDEVASGIFAGVAGINGIERFASFEFQKHRSFNNKDCPSCQPQYGCPPCSGGATNLVKVVIHGIVATPCNERLSDCAEFNGAFILDSAMNHATCNALNVGQCEWGYDFNNKGSCCSSTASQCLLASVLNNGSSTQPGALQVGIHCAYAGVLPDLNFVKALSNLVCIFDNEDVPLASANPGGGCGDGTGVTCKITSLL